MNELEQIRDILLQHMGRNNCITSKQISAIMGYSMEDTQQYTRKQILKTAEEFNLPLLSCNRGYYIATTQEEFNECIASLQRRSNGIQARIRMITENFEGWNR